MSNAIEAYRRRAALRTYTYTVCLLCIVLSIGAIVILID